MEEKVRPGFVGLLIGVAFLIAVNVPLIELREGWICKPSIYCPASYQDRWGEDFPRKLGLLSWVLVRPALFLFDSMNGDLISYAESRSDLAEHERRIRVDPGYAEDFAQFEVLDLDGKISRSIEGIVEAKVSWGQYALGAAIFGNVILLLLVVKCRSGIFETSRRLFDRIWR